MVRGPRVTAEPSDHVGHGPDHAGGVGTVDAAAAQEASPDLATPDALLGFLANLQGHAGTGALVLVLDEIHGIANTDWFPRFIKSVVDANAVHGYLPLLTVLCGTPDRRRQMIAHHRPIERIWDPVTVDVVDPQDVTEVSGQGLRIGGRAGDGRGRADDDLLQCGPPPRDAHHR